MSVGRADRVDGASKVLNGWTHHMTTPQDRVWANFHVREQILLYRGGPWTVHKACALGRLAAFRQDMVVGSGWGSAMNWAAEYGHLDVVRWLHEHYERQVGGTCRRRQ